MSNKIIWTLISLFLLTAIGAGGYAVYYSKYGKVNWAKEAVTAKMIDGESARFRNVREVDESTVCGEVNAKNRYGAYVGFSRFAVIAESNTPTVYIDEDSKYAMYKIYGDKCGKS